MEQGVFLPKKVILNQFSYQTTKTRPYNVKKKKNQKKPLKLVHKHKSKSKAKSSPKLYLLQFYFIFCNFKEKNTLMELPPIK
jgi:hypothetical protein